MEKIIRTLCLFSEKPSSQEFLKTQIQKLNEVAGLLAKNNFVVQTKRMCLPHYDAKIDDTLFAEKQIMLCMGSITASQMKNVFENFLDSGNKNLNLNLTNEKIMLQHTQFLFEIIKTVPQNLFNFAYTFNVPPSSPFFPSAHFEKEGFSVGLQSTNLSAGCKTLQEWFENMTTVWTELYFLLRPIDGFLGIDSSVAPLFDNSGSFINLIKKLCGDFSDSVTTDIYTQVSKFIKDKNPIPVGLCGLMFPCLEDFDLANEYDQGKFNIERNIFLSLHSGLGIDVYPVGVDEQPERIVQVLQLIQSLSNKYKKPLSVRFVSDGKAKIGEKTDLQNPYLKDVVIRKL